MPIRANDSSDAENAAMYNNWDIENLDAAWNTRDEVDSASKLAQDMSVIFVSSTDHLQPVVGDPITDDVYRPLFVSSSVSFSVSGPEAVVFRAPKHSRPVFSDSAHPKS